MRTALFPKRVPGGSFLSSLALPTPGHNIVNLHPWFYMCAADIDDQDSHAMDPHACPSRASNLLAALGPQVPAA